MTTPAKPRQYLLTRLDQPRIGSDYNALLINPDSPEIEAVVKFCSKRVRAIEFSAYDTAVKALKYIRSKGQHKGTIDKTLRELGEI